MLILLLCGIRGMIDYCVDTSIGSYCESERFVCTPRSSCCFVQAGCRTSLWCCVMLCDVGCWTLTGVEFQLGCWMCFVLLCCCAVQCCFLSSFFSSFVFRSHAGRSAHTINFKLATSLRLPFSSCDLIFLPTTQHALV